MGKNEIDLKLANSKNIYKLFFEYERLSKPQIVKLLNLSLPTVSNNISELEAEGKIRENGVFQPQGGRPAIAYELVEDAFITIGVEIQQKKVRCIALDLLGQRIHKVSAGLYFSNELEYTDNLCSFIHQFIRELNYPEERILGIGFSVQGIVSKDGKSMIYSRILSAEYFEIEKLQPYFKQPLKLFHDVKCAALTELWFSKQINNAVYISISEHLGGSIILNNQIDLGKNGCSGALEHLQIHTDGNLCYCGQHGCLETYCSLSALLAPQEDIETFFTQLREGEELALMRWDAFLSHLAKGLNILYLLLERDIILGGEIAFYLLDEDLKILQKKIQTISTFPIEGDFIRIAKQQKYISLIGSALPFLVDYLP